MKKNINYVGLLIVLLCSSAIGFAQQDTSQNYKRNLAGSGHIIYLDTFKKPVPLYDSLIARFDSLHQKFVSGNTVIYLAGSKKDSLLGDRRKSFYKSYRQQGKAADSILQSVRVVHDAYYKAASKDFRQATMRFDSLRRKQAAMSDSLFKLESKRFNLQTKKFDSLTRTFNLRKDSAFRSAKHAFRLDTMRSFSRKFDSARIKTQLLKLKSDMQRMKADSIRQKKLERRKEVFVQIQVKPGQTIYIKQLPADLIVRTSKENIVKLVTTVDPEDNDNRTNQEWFTEMKISLTSGNSGVLIHKIPSTQTVTVQTTGIGKVTATTTATGVVSVTTNDKINGPRGVYGLATANKKTNSPIIIYIPATSKLDIENRYNNIRVENDLVFLNADLSNTDLDLESVDKAIIINRYGSVKAKMIREADINLTSCRFITDNMEKLVITSKYSTIRTGRAGVTDMNSTSDQYVLGEVDALQAQKKFGKLTINELQQSIVFAGASADLKIQNINPAATLIQVENKYADVSLPVKLIPDFELNFKGQHSKVFTSFASVNATADVNTQFTGFTKTAGNQEGSTKFLVNCNSCSVDFR